MFPTMKHGGGGVMVWGCFACDLFSDLFRIQGTLNQHGYHSILQWYTIASGLRLVGLSFVFLQDNDPKHTPSLRKGYLTKKARDGVQHQMTWPLQSPDLNPIEMVWDELLRRVKEKQPTSAQHMWELLQNRWKSIPSEAGWENGKTVQSCHPGKGWLLWRISNIKYILIYLTLFLVTTWYMCYFLAFMSSLLFYNVEKFKWRKTLEWVGVSDLLTATEYRFWTCISTFLHWHRCTG